jgi:gluconate kinase
LLIVNCLRSTAASLNQQKRNDMNKAQNNIAISSVVFISNDPEVLVKGSVSRGKLSFETELLITQTQLNMVLNQLRKQNESFRVDNYLQSEQVDQYEQLYYADFASVQNTTIDMRPIIKENQITQIRA